MLRVLLAISVLMMSCLGKTSLELCAHETGEVHLFFYGDKCEGQHAEQHASGHDHGDSSDSSHGHHHESRSDAGDGEQHEPCEHEFLTFEGEWLTRATHAVSVDLPQPDAPQATGGEQLATAQWTRISKEFPPRAPPWHDGPKDYFLATIRLLV